MAYYCLAILGPQYIWWWNFEGLRVTLIVALSTMIAFGYYLISGMINFALLYTKLNAAVVVLWSALVLSYFFGSYTDLTMASRNGLPWILLNSANKIFLFYLISTVLIDDLKKAKVFSGIIIVSTIYLIYWANYQYFTQNWYAFNHGRLMGPHSITGASIYADENTFAMFFVSGIPFLFYFGLYQLKGIKRYLLWLLVPMGWHAIFLTGSRGGLVGLSVTLFMGVMFSNKKKLAFLIIPLFFVAYQWQAGALLQNRSSTIANYERDSSAEDRLEAWAAAFNMMNANPLTGVGIGSFIQAMYDYSDKQPRATHSTPLQFGAEAGYFALLSYCYIIIYFFYRSYKIRSFLKIFKHKISDEDWQVLMYLNEANIISFSGLIVCSLFLSLNYYEIFFYLLILFGFLNYFMKSKLNEFNGGFNTLYCEDRV